MSTTLNHDHHDDEQNAPDVRKLAKQLERLGIECSLENTGGGVEVLFVPAGAHEVTISDDWQDDGYLAVDRPYRGHLWDDEGDATLPCYEGDADGVVEFIKKVRADHPVLYWVWVDADDREVSPRWQAPQDANEFSVTGARLVARGQHPIPTSNRIDDVLVSADDAFWQEVAQAFPEAEFGDFSPEQTIAWEAAARAAIEGWVANNVPQTTTERTEA